MQLEHDDESEAQEQESKIEEEHQAAASARVGAQRMRSSCRFDDDSASLGRFRTHRRHFGERSAPVRAVRVVT